MCLLKSRKECCLDEVAELSSSGYRVNVIQNFSPEIQGIMLSYSKQVRLVAGASIPWFRRDFFPCEDTPSSWISILSYFQEKHTVQHTRLNVAYCSSQVLPVSSKISWSFFFQLSTMTSTLCLRNIYLPQVLPCLLFLLIWTYFAGQSISILCDEVSFTFIYIHVYICMNLNDPSTHRSFMVTVSWALICSGEHVLMMVRLLQMGPLS